MMTVMTSEEQQQKEHKRNGRKRAAAPSRHARIMRGIVTPIFGLLAVACISLGILNATYWKPSSQITATASIANTRYIVTDPGVLPLVDSKSTFTADSSSDICVALASSKDVAGWVAGHSYVRVTGLSDWSTLATENSEPQGQKADSDNDVAFKDSDMWSTVSCGKGNVSIDAEVADTSSTVALVDLGKTTDATVRLHWVRQQLPDFAMPFYFAGGLLAVLAVLSASVFAMPPHKRRKRVVSGTAKRTEEVTISEALTGSMASIKAAVSYKPRAKRRRHAAHRAGGSTIPARDTRTSETSADAASSSFGNTQSAGPIIVDPSARNLVADQQSAQSTQATGSSTQSDSTLIDDSVTSVISTSELEAYFARLSKEVDATADVQESASDSEADGAVRNDNAHDAANTEDTDIAATHTDAAHTAATDTTGTNQSDQPEGGR